MEQNKPLSRRGRIVNGSLRDTSLLPPQLSRNAFKICGKFLVIPKPSNRSRLY